MFYFGSVRFLYIFWYKSLVRYMICNSPNLWLVFVNFFFFFLVFICSGFCHTLKWNSHGFCQFLDDFFVGFFFKLYLLLLAVLALHCCTRLSLAAVIRGPSPLRCEGFSLWWLLLLRSTGSRLTASVAVPHGLSCSSECGIFLDHGSNLCPLHWPPDS